MTIRLIAALAGLLAVTSQGALPVPATITVSYATARKDDTANRGSVTMLLKAGEVRGAVVWQIDCRLAARANMAAAAPGVDQYWTFKTDLAAAPDGRPGVRVRYERIRIALAGPQPPEKEQWLPLDGTTPLTVTEASWRPDCRFNQFTMTVTARSAGK